MMWVTWRQFRWQAITAAAVLAALAVVLAVTGPDLVARYDQAGLSGCHATCGSLAGNFIGDIKPSVFAAIFYIGIVIMYLAPALMGIFWGAPLVAREMEAGTHRLAWNQSISRTRWTAVKLALVGLAAVATAGLLSLMISWWASPIDDALSLGGRNSPVSFSRLNPLVFAARGVAPLGYAAFAFALGVTVGVLIRRTIPAMAITLVIFAAAQLVMPNLIRPHLITPETATAAFDPQNVGLTMVSGGQLIVQGTWSRPGAWVLSDETITPAGHEFTGPATQACLGNNFQACENWLASKDLRQLVTYQPASRFWPLQWLEAGIYVILAAGLACLCIWQVRRRRS
jgi:uncharacterized membrane protein